MLGALVLLAQSGCDKDAADKQAIRATYQRIHEANQGWDGETAPSLFSASSIARYERLLNQGLDGRKAELERLDPWDLSEVFLMRIRATRKELEGLSARGYVVFATSKGWYRQSEAFIDEPRRIRINGDRATVHFYFEGEPTGDKGAFVREDGVWKWDEESWRVGFNAYARAEAEGMGVPVHEYLVSTIEEESGKKAPANIWLPMK